MPRFFLNIRQGELACPRLEAAGDNIEAARHEAVMIFADLAGDIAGRIAKADWQIEVSDESGKLVFRVSVCAETLGATPNLIPGNGSSANCALEPSLWNAAGRLRHSPV
jgi:hypothetical protein